MRPGPIAYIKQRIRDRRLERKISVGNPGDTKGLIVLAAIGADGFKVEGKGPLGDFFPMLCDELRQQNYETVLTSLPGRAANLIARPEAVSLIIAIHEERDKNIDPAIREIGRNDIVVFNSVKSSEIIADKEKTNKFLSDHGVSLPRSDGYTGKTFSIARSGSGTEVVVSDQHVDRDLNLYGTEYIDTRVAFEGREYYTMVRLMCVGRQIVSYFPAARPVSENNYSVHGYDTPLDRDLIAFLTENLIEKNMEKHVEMARKISDALGPGFYHHDVLVERGTDKTFLAETGLKFFPDSFSQYISGMEGGPAFPPAIHDMSIYVKEAAHAVVRQIEQKKP